MVTSVNKLILKVHRIKINGVFALLMACACSTIAQEKMYVFYPSVARPQAVQDKLQSNFKNIEVTVFGRYNDFITKMDSDSVQIIVSKPSLIKQYQGYEIKLNGVRNGKTDEVYVLVTTNGQIDLSTIGAESVIGTMDILGRNGMNTFAQKFFPILPKLKRVTKVEDLLPLLTFNMAIAVLVQEPEIQYFKSTSNLNFVITRLPESKEGIISLAVKNSKYSDKVVSFLKSADKELCSFFEVDLWK